MGNDVEQAQLYYDALAHDYDHATSNGAWTPNQELEGLIARSSLTPAAILDLGSGTGQSLDVLCRHFPAARLVGVDHSSAMINESRARLPKIDYHQVDIETFLLNNTEKFDLVTAIGCLEFITSLESVLEGIGRILTPNGSAIITVEPIIRGLGLQSELVSTSAGRAGDGVQITTHRIPLPDIRKMVVRDFLIVDEILFKSYVRAGEPVIYAMLRLSPP